MHTGERKVWIDGAYAPVAVYQRAELPADAAIEGPALVEQYDTCTYVAPRWIARSGAAMMILERSDG
jgi:N-methylhydantoinase A